MQDVLDALRDERPFEEAVAALETAWCAFRDEDRERGFLGHAFLLLRRFPVEARPIVEALRARLGFTTLTRESMAAFAVWCHLNELLGEQDRTLAWYDVQEARTLADPELLHRLQLHVLPLLERAERWSDISRIVPDPLVILDDVEKLRRYTDVDLDAVVRMLRCALESTGRLDELASVRRRAAELARS